MAWLPNDIYYSLSLYVKTAKGKKKRDGNSKGGWNILLLVTVLIYVSLYGQ